jgi:hypothetical protein
MFISCPAIKTINRARCAVKSPSGYAVFHFSGRFFISLAALSTFRQHRLLVIACPCPHHRLLSSLSWSSPIAIVTRHHVRRAHAVTSDSTVFGHAMVSACFADVSTSSSPPVPVAPQVPLSFRLKPWSRRFPDTRLRWAMPQKRAPQYLSAHVTHVVRDILLGTTRCRIRSICE